MNFSGLPCISPFPNLIWTSQINQNLSVAVSATWQDASVSDEVKESFCTIKLKILIFYSWAFVIPHKDIMAHLNMVGVEWQKKEGDRDFELKILNFIILLSA